MNRDYALMDAALRRSREGLRLLEDAARFVLNQSELAHKFKLIRHNLNEFDQTVGFSFLTHARLGGEVAPLAPTPQESTRNNLFALIRANAGRALEALRSLEEFSKLYAPVLTPKLAGARYELYQLELALARLTPHYWLDWHNVSGFIYPVSSNPTELIEYISNGARVVQLRDKKALKAELFSAAKRLAIFVADFNRKLKDDKVLVIINDHVDIAARLPVAGVHLGQTDMPTASARRILGSNKIIGRSNNTLLELDRSLKTGADYVSFGPVFNTPEKPDRPVTGTPLLAQAVLKANVPLVAIGGINSKRLNDIYDAGAKNAAVIRAGSEFFG